MPSAAEHADVAVGNQQDAGAAPRRRRHGREWRARRRSATSGCPGRNGARCAATPIGPMPGPPPPCGIANVLCRFRWQTSAPIAAGLVRPTCAFMLAPSMYTCPPCSCTIAQISRMRVLEHAVRGRVGDHQARQPVGVCSRPSRADRRRRCCPDRRRPRSRRACPAIAALAGLVPCADCGISTTSRWASPRDA